MNDINLLRYHNRSAHEINMLLSREISDQFFSRVVLGENGQRTGTSKLVLSLTAAASFVCSLFASYVLYHVIIVGDMTVPSINKKMIMDKVEEYKLELRTGGDPYLKDGYTRIAVVERTDENLTQPIVVVSEYEPPVDYEKQPELLTKPIELKGEPEKRKVDKRDLVTPVFTGNYSIRFLNVNESEAQKVRILAENNDFNITLLGSTKKSTRKWEVYKDDENSKKVIAGRNVRFVKTFNTRSDAVNYLQEKKIAGVVSSSTTYFDFYDMEVCCLRDEAAEKLARGSGVSMEKVKIIKK